MLAWSRGPQQALLWDQEADSPPKGSRGSTLPGRATSAGSSSLSRRSGPKIPLGLHARSQLLNGLGRAEEERGAGRRSRRSPAMPAGLCPPRRWERAVPVASPSPGAPASRARTFLRLSHGPSGLPPRSRRARRPQRGPHGAACPPAAAPGGGWLGGGVAEGCPAAPPPSPATTRGCRGPARRPSRCSKETQLQEVGEDSLEVRCRPARCVAEEKPPPPPFFSSLGRLFGRPRSPAEVTLRPRARRAGRAGGRKRRRKPVPAGRRGCSRSSSHVAFGGRVEFPPLPPRLSRHAGKSHVPVNHNAGQPPACHWSTDSEREIQLTCYVLQ